MDMEATSPSRPPLSFLDTPLEIRREIYRYCLLRKNPVSVNHPFWDDGICEYKISLLLVSRQVGSEALAVLYDENIFKVYLADWGEAGLKQYFAEANIGKIRRMEIVTPSTPDPDFEAANYTYKLDSGLWSPFLANLTKLSIVVTQPLQDRPHYKASKMKKGLKWLRINLQDISSRLSRSCIVEVDDDNREETRAVMEESFPGGYRKVQTLSGDRYFRRNEYEQSDSSEEDDNDDDQDDDDDDDDDDDNDDANEVDDGPDDYDDVDPHYSCWIYCGKVQHSSNCKEPFSDI